MIFQARSAYSQSPAGDDSLAAPLFPSFSPSQLNNQPGAKAILMKGFFFPSLTK